MEATKDHISLETAKLLKGKVHNQPISCFFKSIKWDKYEFVKYDWWDYWYDDLYDLPAYTWQEILWEYPYKFGSIQICERILLLLRIKEYKEADEFFRRNSILINNL